MCLEDILDSPVSILILDNNLEVVRMNECFMTELKKLKVHPEIMFGKNIKSFICDFKTTFYRTNTELHIENVTLECVVSFKITAGVKALYIECIGHRIVNDIKQKFIHHLGDEIKNPMHMIVKMLNLLSDTKCSQEQEEYIEIIKENSLLILKTNNDIMDYLNLISGKVQVNKSKMDITRIKSQVKDLVKAKIKKKSVTLQIICELENTSSIYIDNEKLIQILVSLVYSSMKHTKSGFIIIKLLLDGGQLKVYVKDTGTSLLSSEMTFEVYSNKDLVCNLELPIAKELITVLGGIFKVESTDYTGTTICFKIPI